MEVTLPTSNGWSAMPLLDTNWGKVGAVAKRVYVWTAQGAKAASTPVPIRQADEVDGPTGTILAEAEMALFKTFADWHFRGSPVGVANTPGALNAAEIRTGATVRVRFVHPILPTPADSFNMFGFEPHGWRYRTLTNPDGIPALPFSFAADGPFIFCATRRSEGYARVNDIAALPATMAISVQTHQGATPATPLSKTLTLPVLTLRAWHHEGGPDKPAYWCSRATLTMVPDTLVLSLTGAEVLWRAVFALPVPALPDKPLGDLRRLSIEEAA